MKHLLEVDSIIKRYNNELVVSDVYVKCETGNIIGLLGRNGSGKSTLLQIIFGIVDAETKFIRIDGIVKQHINQLMQAVCTQFPLHRIAIKAHPRSKMIDKLKEDYPDATHVDNRIGFELMLPLFSAQCVFVGDVSSTLFTVKWFKPKQNVYAVKIAQVSPSHFEAPLQQLFQNVDIKQLTYQQLPAALAASKANIN